MRAIQLVHESEVQRQHPRLRIPVIAAIGDLRWEARDLSVGGIGLPEEAQDLPLDRRVQVTLNVPFDDFEMSLPLQAEVAHRGGRGTGPGLRFVDLNPRQLSFLHHVVNGYLSGQVVHAGDVFEVAARDASVEARPERAGSQEPASMGRRLRKAVALSLLGLVAIVCTGFVALSVSERTFVTEATGTLSSRHAVVVRAPVAGVVRSIFVTAGQDVPENTVLAVVESALGASSLVRSPCNCVLSTIYASEGENVGVNQALLGMTPDGAAQTLVAQLPLDAARGVKPGDVAFVDFFDRRASIAGVVESVTAASIDPNSYGGRSFNVLPLARVEIRLDEDLPVGSIGQPVGVRISSFRRLLDGMVAGLKEQTK